jgi:hypothetical protein
VHYAPLPEAALKEGLFKIGMISYTCYLKYACSMSHTQIQKKLIEVFGVHVVRGYIAKVIKKASRALQRTYDELLRILPYMPAVNIDETGHKDNGDKFWTWVFKTKFFCLFKVEKSRGSDVIKKIIGEDFEGVLGCDFFSAYKKYMKDVNCTVQFCLAHLIREIKYLAQFPDAPTRCYGRKLLQGVKKLFGVIHNRENMSYDEFIEKLEKEKKQIQKDAKTNIPDTKEAKNMADRFIKFGESYFTFITTPGIDPTNNIAEQAIRFIVMYRHVSQGTRSTLGREACEKLWTVIATCAMQGRSVYDFIKQALIAHFNNLEAPSLLPDST